MSFENAVLTGAQVRNLMRKHGATMRGIKTKHQITLKRTREVRMHGVRGFFAAEWFWIIVGHWPAERDLLANTASAGRARQRTNHPRSP